MTTGFVGTPPAPEGILESDWTAAHQHHLAHPDQYGLPVPLHGKWFAPRYIRIVNELAARRAVAAYGTPEMREARLGARRLEWAEKDTRDWISGRN